MKILKYNLCTRVNHGTEEFPVWEEILSPVEMGWNEINEDIAKNEAYNGLYTIEENGICAAAPRNIVAGEYVTIDQALYLALENIPCGEPIIPGQNAIKTTVEEQLYERKGE